MDINNFDRKFNNAVDIICEQHDLTKELLLKKNNTHKITDLKKMIILKFYENKKPHDNITNLLKSKFDCGHSNIIYWYNKAKELQSFDLQFINMYNNFSQEFDNIKYENIDIII